MGTAIHTARVTPLLRWNGGKEDYMSCCEKCFHQKCYFLNPKALLSNPSFYGIEKPAILAAMGLSEEHFCEAVGAAIIALERDLALEAI